MNSKEIEMKRKLINARNNIKRKYDMLKENRFAIEKSFVDMYKPIIKPLSKISKNIQSVDDYDNDYILPKKENLKLTSTQHPNNLIKAVLNSADIDYTYGIHYDVASNKWIIGKSYVTIDDKDIVIDGVKYEGTPGLYELLIMSNPNYNIVTSKDRNNYRDIVIQTNLVRRNYDPNEQLMEKEKDDKLKKEKSGYGVLYKEVNQKPVEYKYWNNVHELIDRLQLLWAEKLAGHGGFDNEMLAIFEELYEDCYIEKPTLNFLNI
ncbi:hypothetical protein FQR65_LT14376 [Abscondita terminalis]|nr:hypothetical protein FQR65_LT14376 [Abscondita terminalis]